MKSLKKTLAIVLVCAMVFGLMGVAASASSASFTDTSKTTYGEAIGVMTGIGVFAGTTATTFDPTSNLTREQAAKIITYMLLGSTNAALISGATATSYTDVAADRWSAGYIAYCTNLGILAGNGDGTFNPTGTLTSVAWAKMLLCALGYKANLENFTGASWAINVAAKAVSAGINDSTIALSSSASINREQACQMAFKTLTATEVYYATSGTTVSVGGATVVTGASAAASVSRIGTTTYDGNSSSDYATAQFCEDHFSTLKLTTPVDAFGRPSDKWTFGASNSTIAQASSSAALTYTTSFYPNTAYKALINAGYTFPTTTVPVYVNGVEATALEQTGTTYYTNAASTTTAATYSGNGTSYEFYADSDNVITSIAIVQTRLYKVTAYKADDTTTATTNESTLTCINALTGVSYTAYASSDSANGYIAAKGFSSVYSLAVAGLAAATDVYVLGVQQGTQLLSVAFPTTATGVLTAYTTGTNVTVGGTTYKFTTPASTAEATQAATVLSGYLTSANITAATNLTLVLDAYGYVIGMKATTTASNYAYVLNAVSSISKQAQLLLNDGTVVVATLNSGATLPTIGSLVTYSVATSGVYTLSAISGAQNITNAFTTNLAITTGSAALTLAGTTVYANSNTIFLVATKNSDGTYSYAAYKGIANVPSYVGASSATQVAYAQDATTHLATVVYVTDATSAGTTNTTGTYIFKDTSAAVTDSTGTYYVYNAVVNGAVSTVKVDVTNAASLSSGGNLLYSVTYTSGVLTGYNATFTPATTGTKLTGTGTTMSTNGIIGLTGNGYYGYTSSAVVFYVTKNADGSYTIAASSPTGVATDTDDTYIGLTNTSGILTALYVLSK